MINYYKKYFKYKNKYLECKNIIQMGGMNCDNDIVYKNILGTCWMIVIQMLLSFSDATKNDLEGILRGNKENIDNYLHQLISIKRKEIEDFYGFTFLNDDTKQNLLFNILKTFYIRYTAKINNSHDKIIKPIEKENPLRCELIISKNFKKLFDFYSIQNSEIGGNLMEQYYFSNILGIFFLNIRIFFKNLNRNNYKNIIFDSTKDIGLLIFIENHVCCCFTCNNEYKFYNDNDKKIYNCDWYNLLLNLDQNEDLFIVSSGLVKLDRDEYFDNIEKYYLNYIRVQFITILSKTNFEDKFNEQLSMYIKYRYDSITDFYLLYEIYNKTVGELSRINYLSKSAKNEFCYAQYLLGKITNNIELLIKAVNNGSLVASYHLGLHYKNFNDFNNSEKYLLIAYNYHFYTDNKETQKNIAKNLYEIYHNYYKNYKLALKFKKIISENEAINELQKIENFKELKTLADQGFYDLQYDIGKIYLEQKNIDSAIDYFNLAVNSKQFSLYSLVGYELAKIYEEKKDIDKAIDNYFLALLSINIIISMNASFKLGQIYYENNDLFSSIFYFKETIKKIIDYINSKSTDYLKLTIEKDLFNILGKSAIKLSELLINQKKDEAIKYLKLAFDKGSTEVGIKLSEILINQKKEDEAIKYLKLIAMGYNKILKIDAALKLSDILINQEKEDEAIEYLKIVVENESFNSNKLYVAALKLGEIYNKNKDYENAVKYFKIVINSKEPEMATAYLSKIYLKYYKNYRLGWKYRIIVLNLFEENIKKLENFKELKTLADQGYYDLQYEVGIKYLNENNVKDAIIYLKMAIETKEKELYAKVALKLGEIALSAGTKEDAIYYFNKAIEKGEIYEKTYAYFKLGEIYENENIDKAIDNYVIVLLLLNGEINEISILSNLKLGKLFYEKKNFTESKFYLIQGINDGNEQIISDYILILFNVLKEIYKNYGVIKNILSININNQSKLDMILNKIKKLYGEVN